MIFAAATRANMEANVGVMLDGIGSFDPRTAITINYQTPPKPDGSSKALDDELIA